jgi:hypothetical protein
MAGELGAVFKGLARQAATTARNIAESAAKLAEKTARIEESNLAALGSSDAKAAEAITAAGKKGATVAATTVVPSSGRTFVSTPWGAVYDVPAGWTGRVADNGKGLVFQKPGSTGNADLIRIMDPTAQHPNGYARVHNQYGQPVDVNGKPGSKAATHIPAEYVGPWPAWP